MNNSISFGQFVKGDSWIYKLDPRCKIILTIALIVLIFLIPNLFLMIALFLLYLMMFFTTRIPFIKVLNGIKGIIFLLLFTVIIQLIYTKSTTDLPLITFKMEIGLFQLLIIIGLIIFRMFTKKYIPFKTIYLLIILLLCFAIMVNTINKQNSDNVIYSFFWNGAFSKMKWASFDFEIYKIGLNKAGYIFFRIILMISVTSLLTLSTMSTDINNGLEWLLSPLKIFKIPVSVFSMLISLTLRFIPTLMSESKKIMNAQASRGVDFEHGGPIKKVKQIISLLVPMFVVSFKRADELSNAMEARGYIVGAKRTKLDLLKFRWRDYLAYSITIALFVTVILFNVGVFKLYGMSL